MVPGDGLKSRRQIAAEVKWETNQKGLRVGTVSLEVKNADSILVLLMIGSYIVRRQWFVDPTKARNNRLLAVQSFDKELRMIKEAVMKNSNSDKFELGVAALFFLLGFNPAVQLETDAPDLIVATPIGRLVLVECTMRIADFATKVGKLVDRRGALTKALQASGHPADAIAILVCRLPRDQIAAQVDDLKAHNIILWTGETLQEGLDRVRLSNDPDKMLEEAEAELTRDVYSPFQHFN